MDKERFQKRARELRAFDERMRSLVKMPDRATGADLQLAADLVANAAADLEELLRAQLPGCTCCRIQDDNYDYLVYAEDCRHHRHGFLREQQLKADYAKAEKKLKDEVRMSLVRAALSGTATLPAMADLHSCVERAIQIADETIRQITQPSDTSEGLRELIAEFGKQLTREQLEVLTHTFSATQKIMFLEITRVAMKPAVKP